METLKMRNQVLATTRPKIGVIHKSYERAQISKQKK